MHRNSNLIFEKYAKGLFKGGMRVLEIGPSNPSSYKQIVGDDTISWETLDLYAPDMPGRNARNTYVTKDEYAFPIADGVFDVVLSGNVIEHVRKVWVWMKEVARVCKPGGYVITINPANWPYHEAPIDCWRIYPEGMKALYEDSGLETVTSVFESLEPWYRSDAWGFSPYYLLKQAVKPFLGRVPLASLPVIDTISVGRKR